MLISMRRQLRGEDGCVARFNGKFKRSFNQVRNRWRKALHGICVGSKEDRAAQLVEYKGFGRYAFAFWEDCTIQMLEENIDTAVTATRRKMHGRDRTEFRRELNDRVKRMEEAELLASTRTCTDS